MESWNPGRHDISGSAHANLATYLKRFKVQRPLPPTQNTEQRSESAGMTNCAFSSATGEHKLMQSLLNVYRLLKLNLFLLVKAVGIAASVEFLDEAQVGKVLGLGRFCLRIFFRQRS